MFWKVAVVALAAIGMSGCATIVQGSKQTMSVNTTPVDGAKCELKNATGTWYLTTPGSVEVHKTKTDLEIACSKEGAGSGKAVAKAKFGGTTFGNVIAGGLVGVAVDAASGANFYYESPVTVVLAPDGAATAAAADGKPADAKPADQAKPTDANATDAKAADAKSADQAKPADVATPADAAKPADQAKPADAAKSTDVSKEPAKPADKPTDTTKPAAAEK